MSVMYITMGDAILTGQYTLTGALALIATPTSWRTSSHDIFGLELWASVDWTLSYSSAGDGVLVPANQKQLVNIRMLLDKGATTLAPNATALAAGQGVYVTGAGTLNILAHKLLNDYADRR